MPKIPTSILKRVAKEQAPDPLAALVATRMAGQLEAMSPLMGLKNVNLPAAYAGDQRSLVPVLKQLQERENIAQGLPANPSRRKMLKQTSAMAARQAIPDAIMPSLPSIAEKLAPEVIKRAIPDESIQAAIAMNLDKALGSKAYRRIVSETGDTHPADLLEMLAEESPNSKSYRTVRSIYHSLTPEGISKTSGLPLEEVKAFIEKNGNPHDLLSDWHGMDDTLDAFLDETGKSQYYNYGFDELPKDSKEWDEIVKGLGGYEMDSEAQDAYDILKGAYDDYHYNRMMSPYQKLLGSRYEELVNKHGSELGDPRTNIEEMIQSLGNNELLEEKLNSLFPEE